MRSSAVLVLDSPALRAVTLLAAPLLTTEMLSRALLPRRDGWPVGRVRLSLSVVLSLHLVLV